MDYYAQRQSSSSLASFREGISSFVESNSLVAKIAFLLLVIFLFVILLQVTINLIGYSLTRSSPLLVDGTSDGSVALVISQDPSIPNSHTIQRSDNAHSGIEFTWSIWVYIKQVAETSSSKYQHIFHKGNYNFDGNGKNSPNDCPGLYLYPGTNTATANDLLVRISTYNNSSEEVTIEDVPVMKWFNVIIRCQNKTVDIYVNGVIAESLSLDGVPNQNYGDVYVAGNGGFNGFISNLAYYNYALGIAAIQGIVSQGPNLKMVGGKDTGISDTSAKYLSLRWFFSGLGDAYNSTS
jgi:hypothetical protein